MLALYKNGALLAIACIFVCLFSNISEAEISVQLPGSADAGRFDERIHKRIDKDKGDMVVPLKIDEFAKACLLEKQYDKPALLDLLQNWVDKGQKAYGNELPDYCAGFVLKSSAMRDGLVSSGQPLPPAK